VILQTDKSVSQDAPCLRGQLTMLPADPDTEATDYFVFWSMYCPDTNTLLTGHAALRPVSGPSYPFSTTLYKVVKTYIVSCSKQ
jgi:hypothetical protein